MRKRIIPLSGMEVSCVSLGTMTFGSPVKHGDAVDLSRYAFEQGVNLFDTANMYEGYNRFAGSSGGVAEEILGEAVSGIRDKVYIATKLGMKVGNEAEDEGTSGAAIRKQLPLSLERLKTDYIDIYYLHKPGPTEELDGTLDELAHALRNGYIRSYGVSNYSAAELSLLLEAAKSKGVEKPAVCQPPLSLLKTEALRELIPLCVKESIAVSPYQIFQGGLLTGKYKRGEEAPEGSRRAEKPEWMWPENDDLYDKLEQFERQAGSRGMNLMEYALAWTLEQPGVVSSILGVKSKKQIDDFALACK